MTQEALRDAHPADSDILRFHDGECPAGEAEAVAQHIADCPRCAATSQLFHTTTERLHAALDDMPLPSAPGAKQRFLAAVARGKRRPRFAWIANSRGPLLRAAVVIFALFAVSMAAAPVRAWVFRLLRIEQQAPAFTVSPQEPHDTPAQATSSTVTFVPTTTTFVIDVAARQAVGALTIRGAESNAASARITGRSPGDALLVRDDGFRIQNSPESTAQYTVIVPWSVRSITVRIAGGDSITYSVQTLMTQDSVVVALQ
jgi:hypothetical protein